jgi:hypothetical protein
MIFSDVLSDTFSDVFMLYGAIASFSGIDQRVTSSTISATRCTMCGVMV